MRPGDASRAADGGVVDYRKQFRVKSGEKVRLNKLDPSSTGKLTSEDEGKQDAEHYLKRDRKSVV